VFSFCSLHFAWQVLLTILPTVIAVHINLFFEDDIYAYLLVSLAHLQVLLLMRNLSINLTSPDFEDHVRPYSLSS
jgi:hypothetical protein